MAFNAQTASLDAIRGQARLISKEAHGIEVQDPNITRLMKLYILDFEASDCNNAVVKVWLENRSKELKIEWAADLNI
jgi:hypothetical protein|tara:strand:- start:39 stop:269 length:231 start_codon:yes stop_codon:yes gene_type:complete